MKEPIGDPDFDRDLKPNMEVVKLEMFERVLASLDRYLKDLDKDIKEMEDDLWR